MKREYKPEQYCQLLVMHNGVRRGDISLKVKNLLGISMSGKIWVNEKDL